MFIYQMYKLISKLIYKPLINECKREFRKIGSISKFMTSQPG